MYTSPNGNKEELIPSLHLLGFIATNLPLAFAETINVCLHINTSKHTIKHTNTFSVISDSVPTSEIHSGATLGG